MMRLRAATVLATLTVVTLPLIPVQWLALRLKGGLKRSLPVVWHRIACRTVGIRVREIGKPARERPLLIVANHVSWLDITVLGSRMPLSFVAKTEVASWPVFGLFAKLQRSVFVDRQRRSATGTSANTSPRNWPAWYPCSQMRPCRCFSAGDFRSRSMSQPA